MLQKYLPKHAAPGVVVFEHVVHLVELGLAVLRVVNLGIVVRRSKGDQQLFLRHLPATGGQPRPGQSAEARESS